MNEDELREMLHQAADQIPVAHREWVSWSRTGRLRSWLRWRLSSWERFRWFLADYDHWAGYAHDPVDCPTPTAWVSFRWFRVYAYPWRIRAFRR